MRWLATRRLADGPGAWEWMGRARRGALDLLFPPACVACHAEGAHLCDGCRAALVCADAPRCIVCWSPAPSRASPGAGLALEGDAPGGEIDRGCAHCAEHPPAYRSLRAGLVFRGPARDAIHALKYQGLTAALPDLLDVAFREGALPDDGAPVPVAPTLDVVTAVPMSGRRRRIRGYNQAEVLGRALAVRLGLPFEGPLLQRARATGRQAAQPDLAARRTNVAGAFHADPARVAGREVLVVDDVTTSGATLDACAAALRAAGARAVDGWALARED